MKLDVTKALLNPATTYPFQGEVTLQPIEINGENITFSLATLSGRYFATDNDLVRMEGVLDVTVTGTCARCMEVANVPLHIEFGETFAKEVNEDEDERFPYEGKEISLDQMTYTLCLLNLPGRFLCKEDCNGTQAYQSYFTTQKELSSIDEEKETYRPFEQLKGFESLLNMDEEV